MTEKLKVAVFDNDGKVREIKKYEVSKSGNKIVIVSGGADHWMPNFDNASFLDFPKLKRFLLFGARQWERIYFVKRKGDRCVDFLTGTGQAFGPDPEQAKEAIASTMLHKIGQGKVEIPFYMTVALGLILVFNIIIMNVLGVFS